MFQALRVSLSSHESNTSSLPLNVREVTGLTLLIPMGEGTKFPGDLFSEKKGYHVH